MSRVISWFSCGAASAYATYLAHQKYGDKMEAVYCRVKEESEDNLRFLNEFVEATGIPVKIIGDESMDYSIFKVFHKRKFIKGPTGAPCTMVLKKNVRKSYQRSDDVQIFGYTIDEISRVDRFIDSNNEVITDFILVDKNITKPHCMKWFNDMGFTLPEMYRLGYANNNCIGCIKGGMGYWNAIRIDFPEAFNNMARTEREIGHAVNKGKEGPVYLDELHPDRGSFKRDQPLDCGFTCEWEQTSLDLGEQL
tara:strand:+ start:44 stop:796 length:753 start_codon:yes stop_codon:yes gene_type:complete